MGSDTRSGDRAVGALCAVNTYGDIDDGAGHGHRGDPVGGYAATVISAVEVELGAEVRGPESGARIAANGSPMHAG
ncbi:hypothetical protein [Nocardia sp. NBC_00416]|uniref:hypothetical protein n=1 Tax=Nocardia sp. NBC_00416 TaxID=2975991 RepID=UPI002E23CC70